MKERLCPQGAHRTAQDALAAVKLIRVIKCCTWQVATQSLTFCATFLVLIQLRQTHREEPHIWQGWQKPYNHHNTPQEMQRLCCLLQRTLFKHIQSNCAVYKPIMWYSSHLYLLPYLTPLDAGRLHKGACSATRAAAAIGFQKQFLTHIHIYIEHQSNILPPNLWWLVWNVCKKTPILCIHHLLLTPYFGNKMNSFSPVNPSVGESGRAHGTFSGTWHPGRINLPLLSTSVQSASEDDRAESCAPINRYSQTKTCVLVPLQMKVFTAIGCFLISWL